MVEASGDRPTADKYREVADEWQSKVEDWTVTGTGPHAEEPYYLRVTKDGKPDEGTKYNPGDDFPHEVDQQVDPSFLELVRLGVKRHDDPVIGNSVKVIDEQLSEETPVGRHWHRFTHDGYGEREDGVQWDIGDGRTYGRLWPIFAGERGEYELVAGQSERAAGRLGSIAGTANEGLMLPEQVWDNLAPVGQPAGPEPGTPNFSATPLSWTHGQFVRLAWSVEQGTPVEQPAVVADRYTRP